MTSWKIVVRVYKKIERERRNKMLIVIACFDTWTIEVHGS